MIVISDEVFRSHGIYKEHILDGGVPFGVILEISLNLNIGDFCGYMDLMDVCMDGNSIINGFRFPMAHGKNIDYAIWKYIVFG